MTADYPDYIKHQNCQPPPRLGATLIARVSEAERAGITQLARLHDRTVSREIRRAVHLYLTLHEPDQAGS